MRFSAIDDFSSFCQTLYEVGFALGGENDEGYFSPASLFTSRVQWHTGDPETDPWIWRMRVLEERDAIAYGKYFFRKSGWITREWLPFFIATRRKGRSLAAMYADGLISAMERAIYQCVQENGPVSLEKLKRHLGIDKSSQSRFETALASLQGNMFLTVTGETRKLSAAGEPYGWPDSVLDTVERYWGGDVETQAQKIAPHQAEEQIRRRITEVRPDTAERVARKIVFG